MQNETMTTATGLKHVGPASESKPEDTSGSNPAGGLGDATTRVRRRFTAPRLEPLGEWRALTLQQSVPIFP